MPTVIDSLLIELGLDASKFDRQQKKSVEELRKFDEQNRKTNKTAIKGAKDMTTGFDKLASSLISIGVAAVSLNSIKEFVSRSISSNAQLQRTAQLLNMNSRDLDAWGAAVRTVGGTQEGFYNSLQHITSGIAKFQQGLGGGEVMTSLALLGVQTKNGAVNLYQLSDALQNYEKRYGEQKALNLAQQLGLDQGTFQLLRQGGAAVKTLHDQMYGQSGKSDVLGQQSEELQKKWATIKQEFSGLSDELYSSLIPALDKLADSLIKVLGITNKKKGAQDVKKGDLWSASFDLGIVDFLDVVDKKIQNKLGIAHYSDADIARSLNVGKSVDTTGGGNVGGNIPRNVRNNNPGNIEYGDFARAYGATGSDGRFAIFPTMQAGQEAMLALLRNKEGQGLTTIAKLIGGSGGVKGWLGSGADNAEAPSYIADVARRTGINPNQPLRPDQLMAVQQAMAAHEGMTGAYATAPMGAGSKTTVETHIQNINVQTQATDADGIAKNIKSSVQNNALIGASLQGLY